MKLSTHEIMEATGANLLCGQSGEFSEFSIDTRKIQKGELFFAIKGERFDGNDFLNDALSRGAGGVVTNRQDFKTELPRRRRRMLGFVCPRYAESSSGSCQFCANEASCPCNCHNWQ